MKTKWILLLATLALLGNAMAPVASAQTETPAQRTARMKWWREAKFGMFVHWGVYSVPAGEWNGQKNYGEWFLEETHMPVSQYERFARAFNPVKFDAKAWVKTAKEAGMKYIVITSKHHDGFCLWPTAQTDWSVKRTPFGRDPLAELAAECKKAGITFCLYHSIMDWHHPDWGTRRSWNDVATGIPNMDRYTDYMKRQLKELVDNYHPAVLWFDGEWESPWTHERGLDLYNYCRSLQPGVIVNNRIGKGRAGMSGIDQGKGVGDFGTPEQEIPPTGLGAGVDWETCMTLNNHWGYNKNDDNWKSTATILRNLSDIASKGGNYLLNVGPTAEGLIPTPSIDRLTEIGEWMKVNQEAIYGTQASPFKKLPFNGRCTRKAGKLYLHLFERPTDGKFTLPLSNTIRKAYLLADRKAAVKVEDKTIILPEKMPDAFPVVVAVEIKGEPEVIASATGVKQEADGRLILRADDAEIIGSARLEDKDGQSAIGYWTDAATTVKWPVNIQQTGEFQVALTYACEPGSENSDFEIQIGGEKVAGKVAATKGWSDFATIDLGPVKVTKAGPTEIIVRPINKPGLAVMNLRSITLAPATKNSP